MWVTISLILPVVHQHRVADAAVGRQARVGRRDALGCALDRFGGDREASDRASASHGLPPTSVPVLIFGPWRSSITAIGRRRRSAIVADHREAPGVLLVGAMREVEAHDIHAGREQRFERLFGIGGRADGGDDLGATLRRSSAASSRR